MIAMIAGVAMASITIRNLDDALKRKLRLRAAHRNRSMEDEARANGAGSGTRRDAKSG
jgi:hypothetical protein